MSSLIVIGKLSLWKSQSLVSGQPINGEPSNLTSTQIACHSIGLYTLYFHFGSITNYSNKLIISLQSYDPPINRILTVRYLPWI